MSKRDIENPFREKEGEKQMGRKKERTFTDEEVIQLNEMVAAAVRILRNKEISVEYPEFQDRKKETINILFGVRGITSKKDQEKMWPSLARRIELTMSVPPEEHFQKKRLNEIRASFGKPEDERTHELLNIAMEKISAAVKKRKVTATIIRDAVYQAISQIRYPSAKSKEAEAKVLKYYLCVEYKVSTSDPDLKSISDPSRQKDLF